MKEKEREIQKLKEEHHLALSGSLMRSEIRSH